MSNIYLDDNPNNSEQAVIDCMDDYHRMFENFQAFEHNEEFEMWFGKLEALVKDGSPYGPIHPTEEIMECLLHRPGWDSPARDRWLVHIYECLWLDAPARQKRREPGLHPESVR